MNNQNSVEVEAKILDVSHEQLAGKIKEIGGRKIFDGKLDARWYENVNGERVRVRIENEQTKVEYKKQIQTGDENIKQMQEFGYIVYNAEAQIQVLEALGLKEINRSVKNRVSYIIEWNDALAWVQLDFDKYSDLDGMDIPEFLEIEWPSNDVIFNVAEMLWFGVNDLRNFNAAELADYYKKILK